MCIYGNCLEISEVVCRSCYVNVRKGFIMVEEVMGDAHTTVKRFAAIPAGKKTNNPLDHLLVCIYIYICFNIVRKSTSETERRELSRFH